MASYQPRRQFATGSTRMLRSRWLYDVAHVGHAGRGLRLVSQVGPLWRGAVLRTHLGQLPQRRHLSRAARDERREARVALSGVRQADRRLRQRARARVPAPPRSCPLLRREDEPALPARRAARGARLARDPRGDHPQDARPDARAASARGLRGGLRAVHGPHRRRVHRRRAHVLARLDHVRRDRARPRDGDAARPPDHAVVRRRGDGLRRHLVTVQLPLQAGARADGHGPRRREADGPRGRVVRLAGRGVRPLRGRVPGLALRARPQGPRHRARPPRVREGRPRRA